MEFFLPTSISSITWNGKELPLETTSYGSLISQDEIEGIDVPEIPELGSWRVLGG
jgi:hypothetical protein